MNIEATSRNKALVSKALRHLGSAARLDQMEGLGMLKNEFNTVRAGLLGGKVDEGALEELKKCVNACRHDRAAKSMRSEAIKGFDTVGQIIRGE